MPGQDPVDDASTPSVVNGNEGIHASTSADPDTPLLEIGDRERQAVVSADQDTSIAALCDMFPALAHDTIVAALTSCGGRVDAAIGDLLAASVGGDGAVGTMADYGASAGRHRTSATKSPITDAHGQLKLTPHHRSLEDTRPLMPHAVAEKKVWPLNCRAACIRMHGQLKLTPHHQSLEDTPPLMSRAVVETKV